MKNLLKLASSVAIVGSMFLSVAMAQTPYINHREARQQARINQGVRSGELTPYEAARLQRQQQELARQKARMESDGYISPYERAKMQRELNQMNREIYRQKHDYQVNPWRR